MCYLCNIACKLVLLSVCCVPVFCLSACLSVYLPVCLSFVFVLVCVFALCLSVLVCVPICMFVVCQCGAWCSKEVLQCCLLVRRTVYQRCTVVRGRSALEKASVLVWTLYQKICPLDVRWGGKWSVAVMKQEEEETWEEYRQHTLNFW